MVNTWGIINGGVFGGGGAGKFGDHEHRLPHFSYLFWINDSFNKIYISVGFTSYITLHINSSMLSRFCTRNRFRCLNRFSRRSTVHDTTQNMEGPLGCLSRKVRTGCVYIWTSRPTKSITESAPVCKQVLLRRKSCSFGVFRRTNYESNTRWVLWYIDI